MAYATFPKIREHLSKARAGKFVISRSPVRIRRVAPKPLENKRLPVLPVNVVFSGTHAGTHWQTPRVTPGKRKALPPKLSGRANVGLDRGWLLNLCRSLLGRFRLWLRLVRLLARGLDQRLDTVERRPGMRVRNQTVARAPLVAPGASHARADVPQTLPGYPPRIAWPR